MPGQKQHVEFFRKVELRRRLLQQARPGAVYVPFCGDGDLAAELYADRPMYGSDIDPERVATITARLPAGTWLQADANAPEFPFAQGATTGNTAPGTASPYPTFAIADFDSYADPYACFRAFWAQAPKADRLALFFTDGHRQGIIPTKTIIDPDGNHRQLDTAEARRLYNFYWQEVVWPWIVPFVAPWRITASDFYVRGASMLYFGVIVEAPPDTNAQNVQRDEAEGPDPNRAYKFTTQARTLFLRDLSEGFTRTEAAHRQGVSLKTIWRAMRATRFAEAVHEAEREPTDIVVGSLFQAARSGNVAAIKFWLINKSPDEWRERIVQKVELVTDDAVLRIVADIIARNVTDQAQLDAIRSEFAALLAQADLES